MLKRINGSLSHPLQVTGSHPTNATSYPFCILDTPNEWVQTRGDLLTMYISDNSYFIVQGPFTMALR